MVLEGVHRVWGPVSLALVVLGVLWWVYFGAVWGRWGDVGVYSVAAMLLGFGAAGFFVSRHLGEQPGEA